MLYVACSLFAIITTGFVVLLALLLSRPTQPALIAVGPGDSVVRIVALNDLGRRGVCVTGAYRGCYLAFTMQNRGLQVGQRYYAIRLSVSVAPVGVTEDGLLLLGDPLPKTS